MSFDEIYIRYYAVILTIFCLVLVRANLDDRKLLRWYKRQFDKAPRAYRPVIKTSVCQKIVNMLLQLSPLK